MKTRETAAMLLRFALVCAAATAALASASSQKPVAIGSQDDRPPPPQAMEATQALGLWKSSFGAVKLELDASRPGAVHGVWTYDRNNAQVIGYFAGTLRGNVLDFTWQEPGQPAPLTGAGYLVFDPQGQRFGGRWWTTSKDRRGEWTGWRAENVPTYAPPVNDGFGAGYGGTTYGEPTSPPPPSPGGP